MLGRTFIPNRTEMVMREVVKQIHFEKWRYVMSQLAAKRGHSVLYCQGQILLSDNLDQAFGSVPWRR